MTSNAFAAFLPAPTVAVELARRGVPIVGETAEALRRYETALGRLAFLTLADRHRAMAANPGGTADANELRELATASLVYLQRLIDDKPTVGVDGG